MTGPVQASGHILDPWGVDTNRLRSLGADYTVLVTDKDLNVLGDPLAHWTQLQATLRWKEPGSGQITIPGHRYVREQLVPGCRIVILRRLFDMQHTLIAGPMEQMLRERSDDGENAGPGMITITFVDDMAWLGARIVYPEPALAPAAQTAENWTFTGDAAAAMVALVDSQAGASALAARRVPALVASMGSEPILGTTSVTIKSRLEKVTDLLRSICTLGVGPAATYHPDSLGFQVRQVGSQILFEPARSRDLSGQVHFSFAAGNLKYYAWELGAPELTHPHVGGQGDTAPKRKFDVYPTTEVAQLAWGRFEDYRAMAGDAPAAELQDQAKESLAGAGQHGRLASNAADTPDQRFGVHYNVGDIVSLELDLGEFVTAPVQTINVQAYPTAGEVAGVTIGDQSARNDSDWIRRMRDIDRRVGDLERVTIPARTP